jgi:hypothetical protein
MIQKIVEDYFKVYFRMMFLVQTRVELLRGF